MKKRLLISVLLTVVLLLGCFTITTHAASVKEISAPDVSVSNVASSGKVVLRWNKVSGAAKYKVYRATSKSGTYSLLGTSSSTGFTNTSASAGKVYYYYVVAVDKNGKTSAKSEIVFRRCDLPRPVISTASVASSGKIEVSWKPINGAIKYEIYRSESEEGTYTKMYTTAGTSYINTAATVGTKYFYKVKAIASNAAANSAYSLVDYYTCDCARPVITVSTVTSSGKIRVIWEEVTGAKKYAVYRATSENGTYSLLKEVSGTTFLNTSTTAGKTYYYKVRALPANSMANSAFSEAGSGLCVLAQPRVAIGFNGNGKPKLNWPAVSGAKAYEVYRSTEENGKYTLLNTITGTTFTNTSAVNDTKYYYKVRALAENSVANSAYSTVQYLTTALKGETLTTAYVYNSSVNIYDEPSDYGNKTSIPYMTEVKFGSFVREGAEYGWRRLYYKGDCYYTYLPEEQEKFTDTKSTFQYTGKTEFQKILIEKAMYIYNHWDTYYAHQMSNGVPDENGRYGFDCSGLASYLLDQTMHEEVPVYDLSRAIDILYDTKVVYNEGLRGEFKVKTVSRSEMQPGDVIFFNLDGEGVDHCGIYMGNDEFIQSTGVWDGVCIAPLRGLYRDEHIDSIKRYLPKSSSEVLWAKVTMKMNVTWSGLREEADWDAPVKTKIPKGEAVTVRFVDNSDDWSYVVTKDGKKGFVPTKYLD